MSKSTRLTNTKQRSLILPREFDHVAHAVAVASVWTDSRTPSPAKMSSILPTPIVCTPALSRRLSEVGVNGLSE